MLCKNCGKENSDGSQVCKFCGQNLTSSATENFVEPVYYGYLQNKYKEVEMSLN